jgi:hypothetical protein
MKYVPHYEDVIWSGVRAHTFLTLAWNRRLGGPNGASFDAAVWTTISVPARTSLPTVSYPNLYFGGTQANLSWGTSYLHLSFLWFSLVFLGTWCECLKVDHDIFLSHCFKLIVYNQHIFLIWLHNQYKRQIIVK